MARFAGMVGYGFPEEDPPGSGIFVDKVVEKSYKGDVVRNTRRLQPGSDSVNDDISMSNSISILPDRYAVEHFAQIKYVIWRGVLWTVPDVEYRAPRLILSLGGVYNGATPRAPGSF